MGEMHVGLTQTMSKNLSFGQPFHVDSFNFRSGQSSQRDLQQLQTAALNSGRRVNPHMVDLPLQILSETSSDPDQHVDRDKNQVKYDFKDNKHDMSNECTSDFAKRYNRENNLNSQFAVKTQHHRDNSQGCQPYNRGSATVVDNNDEEQDNSFIDSNFDNSNSMIQQ